MKSLLWTTVIYQYREEVLQHIHFFLKEGWPKLYVHIRSGQLYSHDEQWVLIGMRSQAGCGWKRQRVIIRCSADTSVASDRYISAPDWKKQQVSTIFFFFTLSSLLRPDWGLALNKTVLPTWEWAGYCHARYELNVSHPHPDLLCHDTCETCTECECLFAAAAATASNLNAWDMNWMQATD